MEHIRRHVLGNEIIQVLRIRSFFFMMLSEIFSQIAFNMQHFVLIFIIYGFTHSNTAVSGMILSFMIPAVLFSVISGIYVDRWNKKKVLIVTHLVRAGLLLPFLIPNLHLGWIYAFTFLIAIVTQFFTPAESSIIPQLVPKKMLVAANAVFSFSIFGVMMAGYILSGPMLLWLGRTWVIALLISLFLISSAVVMGIKLTDKKSGIKLKDLETLRPNYSFLKEAGEIFVFIKKARKVLHGLFMITIAQSIIFMFAVLAPGYVATILEAPLESLSVILVAPACVGLGLGAFILGSVKTKIKRILISATGFLIVGIVFILMPLTGKVTSSDSIQAINVYLPHILNINVLHAIVVMAFFIGLGMSLVFIPSNTTIQIETSEEMRGRMYGLLNALVGAVSFLPVILAGGMADLYGVGAVITSVGVIMLAISACYYFVFRT